jgi:hypothetical protein
MDGVEFYLFLLNPIAYLILSDDERRRNVRPK